MSRRVGAKKFGNVEPGTSASTQPDGYAIRVWTSAGTYYQVGSPRTMFEPTPNGTQTPLANGNNRSA
jgi:hypothetical protein